MTALEAWLTLTDSGNVETPAAGHRPALQSRASPAYDRMYNRAKGSNADFLALNWV